MNIVENGYEITLDKASKTIKMKVTGKFVEEKAQQFLDEYNHVIQQVNPAETLLVADCTSMAVATQENAEKLGTILQMYKKTGFKKIIVKVENSPIVKMQINRVAKMVDLTNIEIS